MRRSWAIPQQCIYRNANARERLATRFVQSALCHVSPMDDLQPCGGPGGHLWFHRPLTLADTHFAETLSHRSLWLQSCRCESQKHATFWRNRANQREARCIGHTSELE